MRLARLFQELQQQPADFGGLFLLYPMAGATMPCWRDARPPN
jgi:hypothetical protein